MVTVRSLAVQRMVAAFSRISTSPKETSKELRSFCCGENLLMKRAEEIMTKNPKTVNKDSLAAEAVAIMEKNSITCLIVADSSAKPEGVIHLHDLLKAGVV